MLEGVAAAEPAVISEGKVQPGGAVAEEGHSRRVVAFAHLGGEIEGTLPRPRSLGYLKGPDHIPRVAHIP